MAVSLMYMPVMLFTDANGNPVPFAKVYSYQAATTTPLALYADPAGVTPLTNPAICDGGGRLTAYMLIGTAYKINVLDANNVQVPGWPIDNIQIVAAGNPTLIDDYSATNLQASATMDPGEPGTPNLAGSMADEIQQLRFRIREMTGGPDWRTSYVARLLQGLSIIPNVPGNAINVFPPSGTNAQTQAFVVPDGWQPQTDLVWVLGRRSTGGTGVARMRYSISRERNGQSPANIVTTTDANFTPSGSIMALITLTIPGSGLLDRDIVTIALERLGDDAADTDGGNIVVAANYVVYMGIGSR